MSTRRACIFLQIIDVIRMGWPLEKRMEGTTIVFFFAHDPCHQDGQGRPLEKKGWKVQQLCLQIIHAIRMGRPLAKRMEGTTIVFLQMIRVICC